MIQDERVQELTEGAPSKGRYVLYWMQQSQRARCNHALEYAVRRANEIGLPLVVVFGVTQRFPEAGLRHYAFMLEGLQETTRALADRGIRLAVLLQPPVEAALDMASDAALLVCDRGYLRVQRRWRERVRQKAPCPVVQVEGDVVVPVDTASDKEEYAARTFRPKIRGALERFLVPLEETPLERDSLGVDLPTELPGRTESLLERMRINRDVPRTGRFCGGTSAALELLGRFVAEKLQHYADERNDPAHDYVSHMSAYLHFGQMSPLEIALRVRDANGADRKNVDAYLEELIVRRELSMNFCRYNSEYDEFACLPDWARETLEEHVSDDRPYTYTAEQLEKAETHDEYWNAAQREMVATGKMHGYMRMYWGKKILEWTSRPQDAFRVALRLNNKYELDGRDPNSYAGVAWCFGKHDRPWTKREIFGSVRYMNANGLERKFDMDGYLRRVDSLVSDTEDGR